MKKMKTHKLEREGRPFFNRAVNRAFAVDSEEAVIDIYDEIGFFGVTAADVKKALSGIKAKSLTVRLNSPGGDVFDGIAIYNDLVDHPAKVNIEISGLAASAASIIAMAGDNIKIASNAFLMIHNAWAFAIGEKADMLKTADILEKIDGALADTYAARTGVEVSDISEMMDNETWLTAEDAVEQGFADEATDAAEAKARFDLSVFQKVPKVLQADIEDTPLETKRDIEQYLKDLGLPAAQAKKLISRCGKAERDAGKTGKRDATGITAALERLSTTLTT